MNRSFIRIALASLATALLVISAEAQPLGTTARQSPVGSLKFLVYHQGVADQKLSLGGGGSAPCTAAAPATTVGFPCGNTSELEAKGDGSAGMLKIVWQPFERFSFYGSFGSGKYSLSVPSTTVSNTLDGDKLGLLYGVGVRASVVPDTMVNPAITLDLGYARSHYNFNRIAPGGTPGIQHGFSHSLDLTNWQVAVETSHLFSLEGGWKLEPYGGVKWTRVESELKDLASGARLTGKTDTGTPFLGLRMPVKDLAALFAEASFVDGTQYAAGLEFRFNEPRN